MWSSYDMSFLWSKYYDYIYYDHMFLQYLQLVLNCFEIPYARAQARGYTTVFMLHSIEHEFFLIINVKMPTIVGILTFMNRKNSIISLSEPKKCWISYDFYTYEHLKFHAQLSWAWKKFYNIGARRHTSQYKHRINVDSTSSRWISVDLMFIQRYVPSGISPYF